MVPRAAPALDEVRARGSTGLTLLLRPGECERRKRLPTDASCSSMSEDSVPTIETLARVAMR
jgi:hypothetical protein